MKGASFLDAYEWFCGWFYGDVMTIAQYKDSKKMFLVWIEDKDVGQEIGTEKKAKIVKFVVETIVANESYLVFLIACTMITWMKAC
jgi:hypothetical protein